MLDLTCSLLAAAMMGGPPQATVQFPRRPSVVGKTYAVAESTLRRLQIRVVQRDSAVGPELQGQVLLQLPGAGTLVRPPAVDTLVVGVTKPLPLRTPRLGGMDTAIARQLLARDSLFVGNLTLEYSNQFRPGTVTQQDPVPGTPVSRGSRVDLHVAEGPVPEAAMVEVPSIVDSTLQRAAELLERRSLRLGQVERAPSPNGDGRIGSQTPPAGDSLTVGESVSVVVRIPGPPPVPVGTTPLYPVPHVQDSTLERAFDLLASAGFRIIKVDSSRAGGVPPWMVVSQAPRAGKRVSRTTRIQLTARLVAMVPVPDLVRLTESDAKLMADDSGFSVQVQGRSRGFRLTGGRVLGQQPTKGSLEPPGSTIQVVIGEPMSPIVLVTIGIAMLAVLTWAHSWSRIPDPVLPHGVSVKTTSARATADVAELNGRDLVQLDVSLHTITEREPATMQAPQDNLVKRSEVHT